MLQGLHTIVFTFAPAFIAAALTMGLLAWLFRGRQTQAEGTAGPVVFLFDGDRLRDATPAGRRLLDTLDESAGTPAALARLLADRVPGLSAALSEETDGPGRRDLTGPSGDRLSLTRWDGFLRVELELAGEDDDAAHALERLTLYSAEQELETLRGLALHAPMLIWKETAAGDCIWANRGYLDLADRVGGGRGTWPPPRLFPEAPAPPGDGSSQCCRLPLDLDGHQSWYDVTSLRQQSRDVRFAVDVTEIVRAERTRESFLQTLTKTFAQLSAGIAVFGADRRLTLFNPALGDLTGLPPQFLSARPTVHAFLDRLRESHILPEPRNYRNWREELLAVENEAAAGTYAEVWTLPEGQTYRVTGRPHPEGAMALLFEDISDEVTLTRHFRAEIDTAMGAIEAMPEALAAFSATALMLFANSAYRSLWHPDPTSDEEEPDAPATPEPGSQRLETRRLSDELDLWRSRCAPGALWARLGRSPSGSGLREEFSESARLLDGRELLCRGAPLPGGAVLLGFTPKSQGWPERQALPPPRPGAAGL